MTVVRLNFSHIPYLGAFALATEDLLVVPSRLGKIPKKASETLMVPIVETIVSGSSLIGILAAGNSNGIIVPDLIDTDEERLEDQLGASVRSVPGKQTALGNQVLANDEGAVVNPDLSDEAVDIIAEVLDVPIRRSTVAGLKNVGSSGVVTNEGALLHPGVSEEELEILEDILKVHADIGTALSGVKYIGTCMVANSNGALTGKDTTGPELGRIESSLGFI